MAPIKHLSDYAPPAYFVDTVDMVVCLDDEVSRFETVQRIRRNPSAERGPLVLAGRDLELIDISLNGAALAPGAYQISDGYLALFPDCDTFELRIVTQTRPGENTAAFGLFLDGENLITHMEPEGFSRITYFQERPDVLARYTVRLEADRVKFPYLLSNGNPVSQGTLPDNRHFAVWTDPAPKPSYIFAIAAGRYEPVFDTYTTSSGRIVRIGIYATARHRRKLGFALGALKRAMAWDEAVFGFEYDLDVLNIVVADTHAIAMENKGLNVLEAALVATDPEISTDEDYDLVERIIAHEYFHNWTGNRITCRDWFQLSLKEGLTRYRDQMFAEHSGAADLARISFVRALRTNQFPEDSGGGAHPVQPQAYRDVSNLYTATVYDKGAEIIRMLSVLLGEEDFIRGVSSFADRFDGQAVTIEDFLGVLSEISGRRLDRFRRWYRVAGTPVLQIASRFDPDTGRMVLVIKQASQGDRAEKSPLHLPLRLAFLTRDGRLRDEGVLEIREPEALHTFQGFDHAPLISINRGFSAPVRLQIDRTAGDLAAIVRYETDGVSRWDAMQALMCQAVVDGMAPGGGRNAAGSALIACMGEVLAAPGLSAGMKAELLTFVHIGLVADRLAMIDIDAISGEIVALRKNFAAAWRQDLLAAIEACGGVAADDRDILAKGKRRLRALCLDYLLELADPTYQEMALEEVRAGAGMTAKSAALYTLCNHDCAARDRALQIFYESFRNEPGALRIWFRAQASSRLPSTAARVAELSHHPDFDMLNTPLAMALFGGFFRQNRAGFHVRDGAGYRLLTEVLRQVDQIRPQGAMWLMPQVMNWRRFEPVRRALIRQELETLAAMPRLSGALSEMIHRALAGEQEAA